MTNESDREQRVRAATIALVEAGERPDRHRLAMIEQRLLATARRRAAPWWWFVLGLGLAAGAVASYWAVQEDQPLPADVAGPEPDAVPGTDAANGTREHADSDDPEQEKTAGDQSPVIYIGQ